MLELLMIIGSAILGASILSAVLYVEHRIDMDAPPARRLLPAYFYNLED